MEPRALKLRLSLIVILLFGMAPAEASVIHADKPQMVGMTIREIKEFHGNYVLLLQTPDRKTVLPIWIGMNEAQTIHMRMARVVPQRPMTHELLEAALEALGAKLKQAEILRMKKGVFIGRLTLVDASGGEHRLDCRPSDLIALAVKRGLSLQVAAAVLKKAGVDAAAPAFWNP